VDEAVEGLDGATEEDGGEQEEREAPGAAALELLPAHRPFKVSQAAQVD
jgi:hypothetical protein